MTSGPLLRVLGLKFYSRTIESAQEDSMKRKTVLFYLPYFFQFSCINHNFSGEALKNATTVYMSPEVNIKLQKGVNSRQFEMFTTNLGRLLLMTS